MTGAGPRRYLVKEVVSMPVWTGVAWAVGCTHLPSAEGLFERKVAESKADRTDQEAGADAVLSHLASAAVKHSHSGLNWR